MTFSGLLLVSFAPGLFWLWFFLRQDKLRPEPKRLVALTFFLGCLATIPAVLLELPLGVEHFTESASIASFATVMLLVVGPVEESCKFAAVRLFPYRSLYFDEPVDGLVYATAASLGFASLENLGYVVALGPAVMLLRAPLSTVAHLVAGNIWGYFLGRQKLPGAKHTWLVWVGLGLAAVVHGTYNVAASSLEPLGVLSVVFLTVGGGVWTYRKFQWGQRVSPFLLRRNYPRLECTVCLELVSMADRYCSNCGTPVISRNRELICSNCQTKNVPRTAYCIGCGDRLLRRPR